MAISSEAALLDRDIYTYDERFSRPGHCSLRVREPRSASDFRTEPRSRRHAGAIRVSPLLYRRCMSMDWLKNFPEPKVDMQWTSSVPQELEAVACAERLRR